MLAQLGWRIAALAYFVWTLAVVTAIATHRGTVRRCDCASGEFRSGGSCLCDVSGSAARYNCAEIHDGPCAGRWLNALLSSAAVYAVFLAPPLYRIVYHVGVYKPPALLNVLLQRFCAYVVAGFLRAAVYLITGLFASSFSDHLVLHALIVAVLGFELMAALAERGLETAQRVVVAVYTAAALVAVCANSMATAWWFHSEPESAVGLVVGVCAFLLPAAAIARGGWLMAAPRSQA